MKVTLNVDGQEMSFTEQELTTIVREHFSNKTNKESIITEVVQKPTEDKWFEVKPHAINQKLFKNKREDERQETTRLLIIEAFVEMNAYPEKYGRNFKTMMPKKEWETKTVAELKEMACKLGDHNADWVEQALEWAQRISNGESWESICNDIDTANWHRLVVWRNGFCNLVGGSVNRSTIYQVPSSFVDYFNFHALDNVNYVIPLVVLYEK
ncbi:MAG: hypothetical protein ACI4UE_06335 [Candidatus Scatovivens sp.]